MASQVLTVLKIVLMTRCLSRIDVIGDERFDVVDATAAAAVTWTG